MFLTNWWYMAGWAKEVTRAPLRRVMLNEPVMMYRLESGQAVAMEDRCAHRNYPLSKGCVIGDTVRCGYHGLTYGPDGRVLRAPGQDMVPRTGNVRSFPLQERHGILWIWMGEREPADLDLTLSDLSWNEREDWHLRRGGYIHLQSRHELLAENLLDTSHVGYLHSTTIGAGGDADSYSAAEPELFPYDIGVKRHVRMPNVATPPAFAKLMPSLGDRADMWNTGEMRPGLYQNNIRWKAAGTGLLEGDETGALSLFSVQGITPETENTTHYFFGGGSPPHCPLYEDDETFIRATAVTLMEDVAAFEAIEENERLVGDRRTINLRNDSTAMAFRAVMKRLLASGDTIQTPSILAEA